MTTTDTPPWVLLTEDVSRIVWRREDTMKSLSDADLDTLLCAASMIVVESIAEDLRRHGSTHGRQADSLSALQYSLIREDMLDALPALQLEAVPGV